jgi:hypothetical protein
LGILGAANAGLATRGVRSDTLVGTQRSHFCPQREQLSILTRPPIELLCGIPEILGKPAGLLRSQEIRAVIDDQVDIRLPFWRYEPNKT